VGTHQSSLNSSAANGHNVVPGEQSLRRSHANRSGFARKQLRRIATSGGSGSTLAPGHVSWKGNLVYGEQTPNKRRQRRGVVNFRKQPPGHGCQPGCPSVSRARCGQSWRRPTPMSNALKLIPRTHRWQGAALPVPDTDGAWARSIRGPPHDERANRCGRGHRPHRRPLPTLVFQVRSDLTQATVASRGSPTLSHRFP
jgi:hypothetical protein